MLTPDQTSTAADVRELRKLPPLVDQAERLVRLGLVSDQGGLAGPLTADRLRSTAKTLAGLAPEGSLLVLHERVAPPSTLAPLLRRRAPGRAGAKGETRDGFVVVDMTDVDAFLPDGLTLPDADVYAVAVPDRGDELRNWTPAEAAPEIAARGRTPMTLSEGIQWVLQSPAVLEPDRCFMTIGSRLRRPSGSYDPRTPALWISNGTGRDGRARRGAPKVGWCWWGNQHTWLGFASTAGRFGQAG